MAVSLSTRMGTAPQHAPVEAGARDIRGGAAHLVDGPALARREGTPRSGEDCGEAFGEGKYVAGFARIQWRLQHREPNSGESSYGRLVVETFKAMRWHYDNFIALEF